VKASAFALLGGVLEQLAQLGLDRLHLLCKARAVLMLGKGAPDREQPVGERKALLTEYFLQRESLGVTAKVAIDVLPADLTAVGVKVVLGPPAIRAGDPFEVLADQLFQTVAMAVLSDPEDRRLGRRRSPQRAALPSGVPAGLLQIHRGRGEHRLHKLLVR
jgi:hypothetical protein